MMVRWIIFSMFLKKKRGKRTEIKKENTQFM